MGTTGAACAADGAADDTGGVDTATGTAVTLEPASTTEGGADGLDGKEDGPATTTARDLVNERPTTIPPTTTRASTADPTASARERGGRVAGELAGPTAEVALNASCRLPDGSVR